MEIGYVYSDYYKSDLKILRGTLLRYETAKIKRLESSGLTRKEVEEVMEADSNVNFLLRELNGLRGKFPPTLFIILGTTRLFN